MSEADLDPRLARYVGLETPAGHRGVGVQVGGESAATNAAVRNLSAAASKTRAKAAEIAANHFLLESDRAILSVSAAQPLVSAMKAAAATFKEESQRISMLSCSSWVQAYDAATPFHVVMADQQLAARFEKMDLSARKILIERIKAEPATPEHLRWAEMLLRSERAVTQITPEDHTALRERIMEQFDPQQFASIQTQKTQIEQLHKALQIGVEALRAVAPGSAAELVIATPELSAAWGEQ